MGTVNWRQVAQNKDIYGGDHLGGTNPSWIVEEEEEEENSLHIAMNMASHNLFLNLQR